MGCGASTHLMGQISSKESISEPAGSTVSHISQIESPDCADQQMMDRSVVIRNGDKLESNNQSSKSRNRTNLPEYNDFVSREQDYETEQTKTFQKKINPLDDTKLQQEKTNENINNINSQAVIKSYQGDDNHPAIDQIQNVCEQTTATTEITIKLTEEKIMMKKQEILKHLDDSMLLISTIPFRHLDQDNAPFTTEFRQCVLKLAKSYYNFKMGEVPYSVICEYRSQVGKALNRSGAVKVMCDALADGLKRKDFIDVNMEMLNEYWFPIKNVVLTLLNFCDTDETVRISVTNHPDVLVLLVQVLCDWQKEHLNKELSEDQNKLVKWSLSILHNCASTDVNVPKLREIGVIKVVLPYVDSWNENVRLSSVSTLALLVNEEEAELLATNVSVFQFMINKLSKALKKEDHKDVGWSAAELTTAIGKLARNDANKKLLVMEGCLPPLVELLSTGDAREVKEAVRCMWTLSFDDSNRKRMVDEPGLVKLVYKQYNRLEGSSRHDCQGVLWSLREELLTSQEYRSIGAEISNMRGSFTSDSRNQTSIFGMSSTAPGAPKVQGHVMISYQWANQEIIKQICQVLRDHGIPVWIDLDYMGGSTLQAMAKAVENSIVVIIAMSQKYKDSPNTRAEAEYTFQQRKTIIPLKMQRDYCPDGWLGMILGTKLYYDFSGKYTFESRMDSLLGAVKTVLKCDKTDGKVATQHATTLTSTQHHVSSSHSALISSQPTSSWTSQSQAIKLWTREDIFKWLEKYNLGNSSLLNLSGEEIIFLHNLRSEAPEFFYHCLESKLGLQSLLELARATQALADLRC